MSRNIEIVGGIRVASNAKQLGKSTPDEPDRTFEIPLLVRECDSTIECGFQSTWGTVEVGDQELELTSGAGWGSGWATIRYRGKHYAISAPDLVQAFLGEVDPEAVA